MSINDALKLLSLFAAITVVVLMGVLSAPLGIWKAIVLALIMLVLILD